MILIPQVAPSLASKAVLLVQLDEAVHKDYCRLMADPVSRHFTGTTENFSDHQLLDWLSSRPGHQGRLDWAILDPETNSLQGEVVLNELDLANESMNLRIALFSDKLSRGIGSQALNLVVEYGLKVLNLRRITLDVWTENHRAIRAYEKVGFTSQSKFTEGGREFWVMEVSNPQS